MRILFVIVIIALVILGGCSSVAEQSGEEADSGFCDIEIGCDDDPEDTQPADSTDTTI